MQHHLISPKSNPLELVFLLAMFTSIGALTIDLQLPAMPLILQSFGLSEANKQQWIITAYMFGFATAQIFYGPVADSVGRRPVLLFGLVLYTLASLMCIFADSYVWFLAARGLQGVGAAACRIMVNTITRDFYAGNEMAKVTSLVMMIFIMVPVFAPSFGYLIMSMGVWQNILYVYVGFGLLVLLWTFFRLPESLSAENKRPLEMRRIKIAFIKVVREPVSMAFAVVSGIIFSGFMAYLNSAEQMYSDIYQVGHLFPYLFGVIALFFGVAAFLNAKVVMKLGALVVTRWALLIMVICNLLLLLVTLVFGGIPPLWFLVLMLIIINICIGMAYGNLMAIAMYPLGKQAGMGSSVIGVVSAVLASVLGILISQQLSTTIYPVAIGFFVTSLLALFLVFKYSNRVVMH
ncbi:MAG: multidrug effflux MFS transporter [Xanthomonadales bacterium]|nr:multidrug effflux MFS transporter [Xanthomonadales bacterium]